MDQYILALDQGTTSCRSMLINKQAEIKAVAQKEFRQFFPSPGFVEHDAQEIWATQAAVTAEVMAHLSIHATHIAAIGITNQRETTLIWERATGRPIARAIVWQDRRTTKLCQVLKQQGKELLIQQKTGLLLDPYFSATKISWLLDHIPYARERAEKGELAFGTIDSYLVWKLTNGSCHITDVTNASRTLLFNIHTCQWDEELLSLFKIPRALLPAVKSSSEVYAETSNPLFSSPLPISGIAGDQQAALIGQSCFHRGMVKTTYGTGCFMLMNTGEQPILSKNQLLTTIAYQIKGKTHYALEGSVFIGGAVVQWLRDNLGIIHQSEEIQKLAGSVKNNNGVYFVPAFTGLGAPYWDPYTRGMIIGLTRGTTAAHIARAANEGIAYQVTDVLKAMEADASIPIHELRVDGGAVSDDGLMQFQADVLGVPVIRPQLIESTALGAAFLAGLGIGFWKTEEEVSSHWKAARTFCPQMKKEEAQLLLNQWAKAVKCARMWEDI